MNMRLATYLLAAALMAVIVLAPATVMAEDVPDGTSHAYIYVYPNSAVQLLVNGTGRSDHALGNGTTSVYVTYYESSTYFKVYHEGRLLGLHVRHLHALRRFMRGLGRVGGYIKSSAVFNRTSNGRVSVATLRSSTYYDVTTARGPLSGFANTSAYREIEAEVSPAVYVVIISVNVTHSPSALSYQASEVQSVNVSGINVTELKVYENSTYYSLYLKAYVNATPAPPNTTLGLVQGLIELGLEPGFLNGSYSVLANLSTRTIRLDAQANVSNSLLSELSGLLRSLAEGGASLGNSLEGVLGPGLSLGPQGWAPMDDFQQGLGDLSDYEGNVTAFVNATEHVLSYIEQNFRIVTPSTEVLNVTYRGGNVTFVLETPLIVKEGATNPKQTLVAIDYLIANASEIYQQNNLTRLAKLISSLDNVNVTLIGKDGVTVSPSQTTLGQLSSVSVTVPSGAAPAPSKDLIGGTAVVVAFLVAAFFLLRRH